MTATDEDRIEQAVAKAIIAQCPGATPWENLSARAQEIRLFQARAAITTYRAETARVTK